MNDWTKEEEVVERERIAEERMPDREKLRDFARRIEAVKPPRLGTVWGNDVFVEICEHLQRANDVAYEDRDGEVAVEVFGGHEQDGAG